MTLGHYTKVPSSAVTKGSRWATTWARAAQSAAAQEGSGAPVVEPQPAVKRMWREGAGGVLFEIWAHACWSRLQGGHTAAVRARSGGAE